MNRVTHFNYSSPRAYAKRRYWFFAWWWYRESRKWGARLLGLEFDSGGWWRGQETSGLQFRVREAPARPFLTITPDCRVIVHGDIYDAAKDFWVLVAKIAPHPFTLEKGK